MSGPRSIAVVRPNHRLGNTVLLTPLVSELEARFPDSRIEIITTGPAAHAVFRQFKQVTAVHSFPARSFRDPVGVSHMLVALKRRSYDLAIDPITHARGGRFVLGWVRSRERIGFRWNRHLRDRMLTHAIDPIGAPAHFAQVPLYLLQGSLRRSDAMSVERRRLDLRLTPAERRAGEQRLAGSVGSTARPCLGIFANATGPKCFPTEWWRRVLQSLRRQAPALSLLEFIPLDRRPRLAGAVPGVFTEDLRLLAATMSATSLLVTADCGVMHLADAGGAHVAGLFRVSDPSRYGPTGPGSVAIWAREDSADDVAVRLRGCLDASRGLAAVG